MRSNGLGWTMMLGLGAVLMVGSAAEAQGIRVAKDANNPSVGVTPARTDARAHTMPAGPMLDAGMVRNWTDANITAHLILGDSLEIEMSRLAITKGSSAAVREFAQMMVADHSATSQTLKREMVDEQWGFAPHPADMTDEHMIRALTELRGLSGAAFDRAYMRHQVMHHDMLVRLSEPLADQAKDDDLEQEIEKMRPTIRNHLERARTVARAVGVTDAQMMNH